MAGKYRFLIIEATLPFMITKKSGRRGMYPLEGDTAWVMAGPEAQWIPGSETGRIRSKICFADFTDKRDDVSHLFYCNEHIYN